MGQPCFWYSANFYGAKDVKDYMPDPKSIIVVNDFDNLTALEHHIRYLIRNRSAYMEYFSWKRKPLSNILRKNGICSRAFCMSRMPLGNCKATQPGMG